MSEFCPLKFTRNTGGSPKETDWACEREQCAWWSKDYQACWIAVESYEERASLIAHQTMRILREKEKK